MDIYQLLRVRVGASKSELEPRYARLVESYRLTAEFAENEEVAAIAKTKLEQLLAAGQEYGLTEQRDSGAAVSPQASIAEIRLALNSSNANAEKLRGADISGKIGRLPECAEKHYLQAIVQLRLDSGVDGCTAAVKELETALKLEPGNEAYTGLLNAIAEETQALKRRQDERAAREEAARLAREQASREELEQTRRREFWSGVGSCVCGVFALPFYLLTECCASC